MKDVELNDKRLNKRLMEILSQLGGQPGASIPAACGGFAETTAAYRFFDNKKATFETILQPHIEATYRRMADQTVVILAQDTTEIDLTRPTQQVSGAGTLDGSARFGVLLHPLVAFTTAGTPLGTAYAELWTRDDESTEPLSKEEAEYARKHTPIEEKESFRWLETYQHACHVAEEVPQTQIICVADSEADIYEVIEAASEDGRPDFIIRACQDRALKNPSPAEDSAEAEQAKYLRERVMQTEVLYTATINVRGREAKVSNETRGRRQPRESRTAEVEVRAARVVLRAPWRSDRKLQDVEVNVVLVSEVNPPEGDTPIEWILLTSLPIDTAELVRLVIQYYQVRWMIEIFFRTLKSGCRVESRRFEKLERLEPCMAVYLIVTWRTLFACRMARELPDVSCEAVFEPQEWRSVHCVVHKTAPPKTPPTLQTMVRMVAQLGGYVNRKRPDEPGPQTVWLGLQRMHDLANCWLLFGPGSQTEAILM